MNCRILPLAIVLACALPGHSATTAINSLHTDNFSYAANAMLDDLGSTLALGSVIQLGYFTITDVTDPNIWDTFVPLTGDGSSNSGFFDTRVGDGTEDPNAGYWNLAANFDDGVHSDLPGTASRVGIRIFNGSSIATSTHFNTVTSSDSNWIMPAPGAFPTPANASIDADPPLTWQSGDSGFATIIPLTTPAAVPAITAIAPTAEPCTTGSASFSNAFNR